MTAMLGKVRHVFVRAQFSELRPHSSFVKLFFAFTVRQTSRYSASASETMRYHTFSDLSSQNPGTNLAFGATRSEAMCESSVL